MINAFGRRWSIKAEYLYYKLDDQNFSGVKTFGRFRFDGETEGHIVRAGLNFHF
jgi:opacity protein-like surface antigen